MTREEALRIATGLRTDFKCESDTMVDFCNTVIKALEPCEDAIDRAEAMTEIMMFAGNVKPDEEDIYIKVSDAVQLLRELPPVNLQEPKAEVLDKIRAEIEQIIGERNLDDYDFCSGLIRARNIIDKYKAESEENKSCDNCKWSKTEKCQPSTCAMIGFDGYGLWEMESEDK